MSGPTVRRRGDRRGGLPGRLPPGERILWQGAPAARVLARRVLHVRKVALYLALMLCWFAVADYTPAHAGRTIAGAACLAVLALAAVGVLMLFAWMLARTTTYTLTDQRLVMRFGIALTMSLNLPLRLVDRAAVRLAPDGSGDIPLAMVGRQKLGYGVLWPHARPWRLSQPEPMLRAVPDAAHVGRLLADALAATAQTSDAVASDAVAATAHQAPEPDMVRTPQPVARPVMA